MTPNELRRFAASADPSLKRLLEKHNGRYNSQPNPSGSTAPPVQSPNPNRPGPPHPPAPKPPVDHEREGAIAAAINLGIPKWKARALADTAPESLATAPDILRFILTH